MPAGWYVLTTTPTQSGELALRYKLMGVTWPYMAIVFPDIGWFEGLSPSTYEKFGEIVKGPKIMGMTGTNGQKLPFKQVLELEYDIRKYWWRLVAEGFTLGMAIRASMGLVSTRKRAPCIDDALRDLNQGKIGTQPKLTQRAVVDREPKRSRGPMGPQH